MKKALLIGGLVFVSVLGYFVVVPIIVNKMIEKNLPDVAAKIAEGSDVELKDLRYDSGLTGGTVYTTVQPIGLDSQSQIKFEHEISTFPVYTKFDASRGLSLAYVRSTISEDNFSRADWEQLKALFNNQPPVILEIIVDYSRNYHLSLTINPAQDPNKSLLFSGLTGDFEILRDGNKVNGTARIQQLDLESQEGKVNLINLNARIDQTRNDTGLRIGTSDLKVDRIEGQSFQDKFSIHEASIQTNFIDRTETVDYLIELAIPQIDTADQLPVTVKALNYQIAVNHIHSVAAAAVYRSARDLHRKLMVGTAVENEQSMHDFTTQNSQSLDQLLRADPQLTQNLSLVTSQGDLNLDFNLNFTGFPEDQSIAAIKTPDQLLPYLSGTLHAKSPVAVLLTTPLAPQLAQYQQQGFLKIEGDNAIFNAVLKDSQFTINEKPVPLPF